MGQYPRHRLGQDKGDVEAGRDRKGAAMGRTMVVVMPPVVMPVVMAMMVVMLMTVMMMMASHG